MHRRNQVGSNVVLLKVKLLLRIRVKSAGSRFSKVVAIPVILLANIRRRPNIDIRRRIVQASLAEELPKCWLN